DTTNETNIKKALNEKEGWQIWWRLLRPHTLTASFIPVFVGTMIAYHVQESLHILLFLAMLVASMLIQAATNMFNEYYDYVRGLDNEKSVGIGGTIVRDGVAPKTVLYLAFSFFGLATLLGVYICLESSWWIALIGLVGMLIGYLYTGGPYPIANTPFGELATGFMMGTVIIGISYYIQTNTVTIDVGLISIPIAIFIRAIMIANNIRDLDGDKANGRQTVASLIGRKKAIRALGIFFFIAYVLTLIYIITGTLPLIALSVFLSAKKAVDVVQNFKGKTKPLEMLPAMIATGKTNTLYGILLGLSLFVSTLFES